MELLLPTVMAGVVAVFVIFYIIGKLSDKGIVGKLLTYALIGGVSYWVYDKMNPTPEFYQKEFEFVSGLNFPASGQFTFNYSTFPNIMGQYESCGMFTVSQDDYLEMAKASYSGSSKKYKPFESACSEEIKKQKIKKDKFRFVFQTFAEDGKKWEWGAIAGGNIIYYRYVSVTN